MSRKNKNSDLLIRPSPFIRSFGDMSSSTIEIVISIGRLLRVTLEASEFGPGRLVASALKSEDGLHHIKTGRGILLYLLKISPSMVSGFDVLLFDFGRERGETRGGSCGVTYPGAG